MFQVVTFVLQLGGGTIALHVSDKKESDAFHRDQENIALDISTKQKSEAFYPG